MEIPLLLQLVDPIRVKALQWDSQLLTKTNLITKDILHTILNTDSHLDQISRLHKEVMTSMILETRIKELLQHKDTMINTITLMTPICLLIVKVLTDQLVPSRIININITKDTTSTNREMIIIKDLQTQEILLQHRIDLISKTKTKTINLLTKESKPKIIDNLPLLTSTMIKDTGILTILTLIHTLLVPKIPLRNPLERPCSETLTPSKEAAV